LGREIDENFHVLSIGMRNWWEISCIIDWDKKLMRIFAYYRLGSNWDVNFHVYFKIWMILDLQPIKNN
jgi:hypothetical protein